ncbi:unnamed protein product, partial [Ectocarpus fasciculatus]
GAGVVEAFLLGAAQDGGFPQFGCYCDNCSSVYSGRATTDTAVSLAIIDRSESKWFLMEAAPQLHAQWTTFASRLRGLTLAGVFLTHAHTGHYPGLLFLGKECMDTSDVPVYATAEMHDFLQANEPWAVLYRTGNIRRVEVRSGERTAITTSISVTPQTVLHRRDFTDTCAFHVAGRSRTLFFCPDIDCWDDMTPALADVITTSDIALLDATFYDNHELPGRDMGVIPHPRVVDTISRLDSIAHAAEVALVHMNHSNRLWVDRTLEESLFRDHGLRVGRAGMGWAL